MKLIELITRLNLERYLPAFEANAVDAETLLALTDADLKELGISELGDRKRILAAIERLRTGDRNQGGSGRDAASSADLALDGFCQAWSAPVVIPLREYLAETHPVAKLWAAWQCVNEVEGV